MAAPAPTRAHDTAAPPKPDDRLFRLSSGSFELDARLPAEVAVVLGGCLPGWQVCAMKQGRAEIEVTRTDGGYLVHHDLLPEGAFLTDLPFEAANAIAGAATGAWIRSRPGWVQLHAAAVVLRGRLTLLLGASGSGKSTLSLELAAAGHRLFGDDRLAVALPPQDSDSLPEGIALGVGPKLRRPLPPRASAGLRRLAANCRLTGTKSVDLLGLPRDLLAAPGESAPIERLVLLLRGQGGAPALAPAGAADVLRAVLPNALAPGLGPAELLAWSRRLVERMPCQGLVYRDVGEALPLLELAP